jgi:hypothetical protein
MSSSGAYVLMKTERIASVLHGWLVIIILLIVVLCQLLSNYIVNSCIYFVEARSHLLYYSPFTTNNTNDYLMCLRSITK